MQFEIQSQICANVWLLSNFDAPVLSFQELCPQSRQSETFHDWFRRKVWKVIYRWLQQFYTLQRCPNLGTYRWKHRQKKLNENNKYVIFEYEVPEGPDSIEERWHNIVVVCDVILFERRTAVVRDNEREKVIEREMQGDIGDEGEDKPVETVWRIPVTGLVVWLHR